MNELITIREHGCLTTKAVTNTLDLAQVSVSAFDWLCQLSATFYKGGARLLQVADRQSLKWDSYVGVVETPCGTRVEILPKLFEQGDCEKQSRTLLRKMIQAALYLKPREVSSAGLELFDAPLNEWVMHQFLRELDHLIKRGIRFDYQRVEEEERFLRGQLDMVAQMRQPPGRQHFFQIRHDTFLPDRPENRVLKWVLEKVCKSTRQPDNWRRAHELRSLLSQIPTSSRPHADMATWSSDRMMFHYRAVKPWCDMILNEQMPLAVSGKWQGISLLFPMERLFEHYVRAWLNSNKQPSVNLTAPARSKYLCQHDSGPMFRLEPDFLMSKGEQNWLLDAKWKHLDGQNRRQNYGLDQGDFYQLFAYGKKYLKGCGELVLIYPHHPTFPQQLPAFRFDDQLSLRVLPFDLKLNCLNDTDLTSLPLRLG